MSGKGRGGLGVVLALVDLFVVVGAGGGVGGEREAGSVASVDEVAGSGADADSRHDPRGLGMKVVLQQFLDPGREEFSLSVLPRRCPGRRRSVRPGR